MIHRTARLVASFALLGAALLPLPDASAAPSATFVVTSDGDEGDRNAGDGQCASTAGPCTLRAAIEEAERSEGADVVEFRMGSGIRTIRPKTPLPIMASPITLDGTTQPGYAGAPLIELDGSLLEVGDVREGPGFDGLVFVNGGHALRGLSIGGFAGAGVVLTEGDGSTVLGCYIGVDATGLAARPNGDDGLVITRSGDNAIGGAATGERNVISGNEGRGVLLDGPRATGNRLVGNVVGLAADGSALPNGAQGIVLLDAPANTIGGRSGTDGNIIAGNGSDGLVIRGAGAKDNVVTGNLIGARGADDPANGGAGVLLDGAPETTLGGDLAARNWVAGNRGDGIAVIGPDARGNRIGGNLVGVGTDGETPRGNGGDGIRIVGAPDNRVGGPLGLVAAQPTSTAAVTRSGREQPLGRRGQRATAAAFSLDSPSRYAGAPTRHEPVDSATAVTEPVTATILAGNVIAASGGDGIEIGGTGARGNAVEGNAIGVVASGAPAGNADHGVLLDGAPANAVGGPDGAGNVIAANGGSGVAVVGIGARRNRVVGNQIGIAPPSWPSSTLTTGNGGEGVLILGASDTAVGEPPEGGIGRGNAIGANAGDGVRIAGDGADRNAVTANRIGITADGAPASNGGDAVAVLGGARQNAVVANRVGFAARHGIAVSGAGTEGTRITGNTIANSAGDGIRVGAGAGDTTIGGETEDDGNQVYGSRGAGIALLADDNRVLGNRLGPSSGRGEGQLQNADPQSPGIRVTGARNRIGPDNAIDGHAGDGVRIEGDLAENTVVVRNWIGWAADAPAGNAGAGIRVRSRAGGTRIGDSLSAEVPGEDGNVIRANGGPGIALEDAFATILGNAIDGNGGLGIDAGAGREGGSAVAAPEWDDGPVTAVRAALRLSGSGGGAAVVEVFAAGGCDPSGFGEGGTLLAREVVAADEGGSARLVLDLYAAARRADLRALGLAVAATATGADGRTSAFSRCQRLLAPMVYLPLGQR